jgi:hypothetical protein
MGKDTEQVDWDSLVSLANQLVALGLVVEGDENE